MGLIALMWCFCALENQNLKWGTTPDALFHSRAFPSAFCHFHYLLRDISCYLMQPPAWLNTLVTDWAPKQEAEVPRGSPPSRVGADPSRIRTSGRLVIKPLVDQRQPHGNIYTIEVSKHHRSGLLFLESWLSAHLGMGTMAGTGDAMTEKRPTTSREDTQSNHESRHRVTGTESQDPGPRRERTTQDPGALLSIWEYVPSVLKMMMTVNT